MPNWKKLIVSGSSASLSNLNVSNAIQFDNFGSGNNTGTTAYNLAVDSSGNVIENSANTRSVFVATSTDTSTNINATTTINWNSEDIKDSGYTHSDSTNPNQITITVAGTYKIYAGITYTGAVQRANIGLQILVNGVATGARGAGGYVRNNDDHNTSSTTVEDYVTVSANDVITIQTDREANSGTINLISGESKLIIEKLTGLTLSLTNANTLGGLGAADFLQNNGSATLSNLTVSGSTNITGSLTVTGSVELINVSASTVSASNMQIEDAIRHTGDSDTFISMSNDLISFTVGGRKYVDYFEGYNGVGTDDRLIINSGSVTDLDYYLYGNNDNKPLIRTLASNNRVYIYYDDENGNSSNQIDRRDGSYYKPVNIRGNTLIDENKLFIKDTLFDGNQGYNIFLQRIGDGSISHNNVLGGIVFAGDDSDAPASGSVGFAIQALGQGNWVSGSYPSKLVFYSGEKGDENWHEQGIFRIDKDGKTHIGTDTAPQEMLWVSGAIQSYEEGSFISASNAFAANASFTNSVTASSFTGSFTGSFLGTASNATTASHVTTASFALRASSASIADTATTASHVVTASFADNATSASYALTASVALNVPATASHADRATSASIADDIKDGAVTNAKLANDNITFGTTEQALGSTVSTLEGLDLISATTGTFVLQIYESSSTIITSGSNIFGNDQSDIQQITGSLKQSGSFTLSGSLLQSNGTISGSFEGDGSSLTGLTADSASVAARATTLSADATASHALTAVTASHTAGTASISNYATSASFAITASHLLGGAGNSGSFSGSFQGDGSELTGITVDSSTLVNATFTSQTSLTASHDLDSTNLIITVFNTDNEVLIPENIRILDNSNVGFDFATSTSGKYVLAKGGHIVSGSITTTVSELTTVTASFVDQTSYTASHAFESKDINVIIYGVNDELLIPQTVKTLNSSSVGVDFAESTSGRIVITKGGHFVSGSIVSASIADVATLARAGSGSFSGSFQGDGSNLTGVASPTGSFSGSFTGSMLISDHILPDTNEAYDIGSDSLKFRDLYLSGSTIYLGESKISINPIHGGIQVTDTQTGTPAQSLLSGSFTGSFSGSYIGDIEGTASIADLATTASHIVTASFADNATSSSIADELSQLATASFALTASHALNGGGGGDITEYTTVEDTFTGAISKQVTHNFGTKNVFVQTYYDDDTLFFPETITTTDTNTVDLTFSNPSTGRVIIGKSGHLVTASAAADSIAADSFTSQTSYTASHNFGTKEVVVQVYDNNDNVIVPSNIRAITDNAVGLDFASSRTGKVIISKGGHIVTGSVIATASVAEGLSPSAQRQNIILATNDLTGSVYSLHIISSSISMSAPPSPQPGDWFKVSQRVPSGSNFTSSLLFGNGSQIMSASTELELDVEDQGIEFIYADATQGWVIIGN